MLRTLWAFIKKETFHILRDTRTLVILFGMPIALVLIFGYTVTNEFKDASIAIVDQSKDDLSRSFIQHLHASGHFRIADYGDDTRLLEKGFKAGTIKMGVIIPPDFESEFYSDKATSIQLIADATEPNYATTLKSYAFQMIRSFQNSHNDVPPPPYQISIETQMYYNPQLNSAYNFVPGVASMILMLISAMMTSLTIAKEKEMGTMDLLLVSPLSPILILIGKVLPYLILAFIDAIIVFAMGHYIFHVPILGSLPLLLGGSLLYLFVSLVLGILISTKAANQQAAMMMSMFALLMPTMLLSGFLFPVSSMPWLLQRISSIVPATYFIDLELAVMLRGGGLETVLFPLIVLTIMLIVLLLASWRSFKVMYK